MGIFFLKMLPCLQINSELEWAVIYIFCQLTVGNRRLNTCIVLSKVTDVPLKIPCCQLQNKIKAYSNSEFMFKENCNQEPVGQNKAIILVIAFVNVKMQFKLI
jgi:hypothetical protein